MPSADRSVPLVLKRAGERRRSVEAETPLQEEAQPLLALFECEFMPLDPLSQCIGHFIWKKRRSKKLASVIPPLCQKRAGFIAIRFLHHPLEREAGVDHDFGRANS